MMSSLIKTPENYKIKEKLTALRHAVQGSFRFGVMRSREGILVRSRSVLYMILP